jgi:hypothetical protein
VGECLLRAAELSMGVDGPGRAHSDVSPLIVVPAFSRPRALARLLASLNAAHFPSAGAEVVISLDGGAASEVRAVANGFEFRGGNVRVVEQPRNLGLREHILWCGDRVFEHEAVIVLEDDLVVDPHFYRYAVEAIQAYANEPEVVGIALYGPRYNEASRLPFEPLFNGGSTYFMQVPCSWGQAWTRRQWADFREWYGSGECALVSGAAGLPSIVRAWPESSWKKYFSAYLIATSRYFVYPYHSYATNCSDAGGVHLPMGTSLYQVPIGVTGRLPEPFRFPVCGPGACRYDAFYEPEAQALASQLGLEAGSLSVDIYGIKTPDIVRERPLCLTSRRCSSAISTFPLAFKPIEVNFNFPVDKGFFSLCEVGHVHFEHSPNYLALAAYYSYMPIMSIGFLAPALLHAVKSRLGR